MTSRLNKVQELLSSKNLDTLLIQNPIDLTYLTTLHLSVGKLIIQKTQVFLIVDGRYYEQAKATLSNSPITLLLESEEALKTALKSAMRIGFDGATLSWEAAEKLKSSFPTLQFSSLSEPLKELRAIKEPDEIKKLKKAAVLGSEGYDFLLTQLKEGMSERELAAKLQIFWLEKGGKGIAFEPIIAFGANSALPHHKVGSTCLKKGDTVLLDIGVILEDYHSDMTRTVFFGEPPAKMKEIYLIVKEAHERAAKQLRAGALAGDLDAIARAAIEEKGYGENYTHGLGHGVGLEIHEWPYLKNRPPFAKDLLKENMCVTIEPGIYLPGLGGVRIEDTYLVHPQGAESLTLRSQDTRVIPYV